MSVTDLLTLGISDSDKIEAVPQLVLRPSYHRSAHAFFQEFPEEAISPDCVVGLAEIDKRQDGPFHLRFLETITDMLAEVDELVFCASPLSETRLVGGEQILRLQVKH